MYLRSLFFAAIISAGSAATPKTLLEIRGNHKTELTAETKSQDPMDVPPEEVFEVIKYDTKIGKMSAYLSVHEKADTPSPAIIWLTGGFPVSSPGSYLWEEADIENEQSARIYRLEGITMMYPTLRGVAGNPGPQEGFYGEVEDVISAYHYLAKLPHIDPKRIYLGGHSTGGTLALLVAESTDLFAGVVALGPTSDDYGKDRAPYKWTDTERKLREPIRYLASIRKTTYIVEGEKGNAAALAALKKANTNPMVHCIKVAKAGHFAAIHDVNSLFTKAILSSRNEGFKVVQSALETCYANRLTREREVKDLQTLAEYRDGGGDLLATKQVSFYLLFRSKEMFTAMSELAQKLGFGITPLNEHKDSDGEPYYSLQMTKEIELSNLKQLLGASQLASYLAEQLEVSYDGWSIR